MKKKLACLVSALLMTFLFWSNAYAASPHLFKDTTGLWWEQSVAECSAANIVGGRGNGLFAPKDSVTRAEAIVFLNRALGHRSEADNYNMAPGGYNFPKDFPEWAKRNVAFAADKGYISKPGIPNMQPKQAASRQEIAVLFANALKLSADGYELTFKDKDAIDPSMKSFVAAAVKHGVMSGKTTELFDPKANVTRGEMAAIVARLFEKGMINPAPDKFFIGKLSAVDVNGKKITVTKGGQAQTYSVDADTLYYRDGKKVGLGLFKANENVKVALDNANKVAVLVYTTANPTTSSGGAVATTTYTGTIRNLIAGNPISISFQADSGTLSTYSLASNVVVKQNGVVKDLTALSSGARAEIKVSGGTATEINLINAVSTGNAKMGYVVNVYLDYFSVRYDDGTSEEIQKTGSLAGAFSQLVRGQRVAITKSGSLITGVTPLSEAKKLFGEVVSIGSSSITIEDIDGYERNLSFASNYKVKDEDGKSIDLDDIDEKDEVEIEINGQEKAVVIKLLDGSSSSSSSDPQGEVVSLKTSGDYSIKIRRADDSQKTYDVKDNVDVYEGSKSRDFDDIQKGDYVKLKLNSKGDVTRIDILDVELVEGEVTDVDTTGTWGITIEDSRGKEKTYEVSKKVDVYEGSKSRDFDDIRDGDEVKLVIDDDDVVIAITILDEKSSKDGTYSGTLTGLDEDDDEITVKIGSSTKTYTLARRVEVERDGDDLDLDEILIGSKVKITVDSGKVEKIEITDDEDITVEGKLYDIDSRYIYLKQENGTHKLKMASNVTLKDDRGKKVDWEDLKDDFLNDSVTVKLSDGLVKSLEVD